jgi:acetylornithine/N-succinyldiaminopimelate aminotransferase
MNLFNLRRTAAPQPSAGIDTEHDVAFGPLDDAHLMPGQRQAQQVFVRGQGSWLWDSDGRAYLDFSQGGAINSLGHSATVVVNALTDQAQTLFTPGPAYQHRNLLKLAQQLCRATDSEQAYLLNSGSEACEAAIKLARKWGQLHRNGASSIIAARQGCHGRSFASLAASGRADLQGMFEPRLPGFSHVPFNDLAALHAAVDAQTVAIMLEPIQSDAGVIPATAEYMQGVERLCRELGILLILDEVQTGMGRCGTLLAEQLYGVRADIVVLGKGLGGGVPLAALLARGGACCSEAGELGGSHHGNALMCAAGLAVIDTVLEPGFLPRVNDSGRHLREGLNQLAHRYGRLQVRGEGLLWALQLADGCAPAIAAAALQEGLLLDTPQADCLRFTPALNVSRANIEEMLRLLTRAFARARTAQLQNR